MTPGNSDDRFGLNGAPEVQQARRVQFGSRSIYTVIYLFQAAVLIFTLLAGPQPTQGVSPQSTQQGYLVHIMQLLPLLAGAWLLRLPQPTPRQNNLISLYFSLFIALDLVARSLERGSPPQFFMLGCVAVMGYLLWVLFRRDPAQK